MNSSTTAAAPSLKLIMLPLSERHSYGMPGSAQEDLVHEVATRENPHLRRDQLRNMISQEERDGYKCADYMNYYSSTSSSSNIQSDLLGNGFSEVACRKTSGSSKKLNVSCRSSICEWMYRVIDHFGADREVVSIALSYIDRVLSTNMCADRRTFKLISSASLHLAIKTHFPHVWHDVGKLLPDLSRGDFIMSDLLAMERELVHSLTWLLNPPTPQSMAIHMLSLLPFDAPRSVMDNITNTTLFLVELSVCDYSFVTTRKSIVAIAAVLNAAESLEFEPLDFQIDVCSYQNDQHMHIEKMLLDIGYHVDWYEVTSIRDRLWSLYQQSSETMLRQRVHSPVTETNKSIGDRSALLQGYPSPTSCLSPAFDNYGNQDFSQNRTRVHSDFDYYGRNHFNCPEVNRHSRPSITHSI